jgi:hypothetical protein
MHLGPGTSYYSGTRDATFAQRFVRITYIPLTSGRLEPRCYTDQFLPHGCSAGPAGTVGETGDIGSTRYAALSTQPISCSTHSDSALGAHKQTEPASAVLTRGYRPFCGTSVTEPGGEVACSKQEVERSSYTSILNEYFEERRAFRYRRGGNGCALAFDVAPAADLKITVKYAVGPQEEGVHASHATARC